MHRLVLPASQTVAFLVAHLGCPRLTALGDLVPQHLAQSVCPVDHIIVVEHVHISFLDVSMSSVVLRMTLG